MLSCLDSAGRERGGGRGGEGRVEGRAEEREREGGAGNLGAPAEAPAAGLESLEDHSHWPAMHLALLASEA